MEMEFYVISFESTHYAMMMEKRLKEKFKINMIPTPRSITASCGLSLKISPDLIEDVVKSIKSGAADPDMFNLFKILKTDKGDQAIAINWDQWS